MERTNARSSRDSVNKVDWDLVVLDEYHFGAWREKPRSLLRTEDEELEVQMLDSALRDFSEEGLPIQTGGRWDVS